MVLIKIVIISMRPRKDYNHNQAVHATAEVLKLQETNKYQKMFLKLCNTMEWKPHSDLLVLLLEN